MDSGFAANQVAIADLDIQVTMSGKPDIVGAPE
jgi:hypothetical protein